MTINNLLRLIMVSLTLLALPACANEMRMAHNGFSFGDYGGEENQDIEILNYRYGDDKTAPTRPSDDQLATGHIPQRMYMGTFSPPGDSLYVKWRVLSTGKAYEDTVDLKSRLPSDMNNKEIHFLIKGPQLYVYLIWQKEGHTRGEPDCPARVSFDSKCAELYPDHWKNF